MNRFSRINDMITNSELIILVITTRNIATKFDNSTCHNLLIRAIRIIVDVDHLRFEFNSHRFEFSYGN